MDKIFRKIKSTTIPKHKSLLGIDIENNPQTGKFICGGVYGYITKLDSHRREYEVLIDKYFTDQVELNNFLLGLRKIEKKERKTPQDKLIPCKIVLFNASYDYWFLMSSTNDTKMLTNGTRIITGELKNGIKIIDLTNHVDGTLEDWIGYLKMEEKWGIKKESLTDLKKRVMSDVRATYELGHFLEDFYVYELGIPLRLTVASASRYLFSKSYFKDYWYRKESQQWISDYERQGFRGGNCQCFKRGEHYVYSYDLNSDYLSVMSKQYLPDPNSAKYFNYKEIKRFEEVLKGDTLFICDVTIEIPNQRIPPLPLMKEKLLFPIGQFRGTFYSPELRYAINNCGVKIKEMHSFITYRGKPYFKDYADFIWKKRQEYKAKKNKGMDMMIKKIGNSLFGSFGQRNSKNDYFGKLSDLESIPLGVWLKSTIIDGIEYVNIKTDSNKEDSSHTFPCIPGFITSFARLDLLKAMKKNEKYVVYCDTDSIKATRPLKGITIGKGLGEWGFEYEKTEIFYKPKWYGEKLKGVPKRAELIYEDKDSQTWVYKKPNRMKESFNRDLIPNLWNYVTKEVLKLDDKRIWNGNKSQPIRVFEQ